MGIKSIYKWGMLSAMLVYLKGYCTADPQLPRLLRISH